MINFNGAIKEEYEDPRNFNVSRFIPGEDEVPDEEFILPFPQKEIIDDQGQFNSCVAQSLAMCKSILEYIQTNKWIDFDPFIIYGTRDYGSYKGVGMVPSEAVKNIYKDGAFLRRDFGKREEVPQIIDTVKEWKSKNSDKVLKAKDYKISGYSFVYSVTDIKKALKNKMPISAMFPVYDELYNVGNDGIVSLPKNKNKIYGYHQMTIVGWTKQNNWIVVNSWGTYNGMKGIYLIPYSYPIDSGIAISDTITPSKYKAKEIVLTIGSLNYVVDGLIKQLDSAPYIKNDRTYIPVRFVTEALGCSVEWKEDTQEVIIRSEESELILKIGSKTIILNNSKTLTIDTEPEIVNDRTMVPIRIICENLNCNVDWIDESRQVKITAL